MPPESEAESIEAFETRTAALADEIPPGSCLQMRHGDRVLADYSWPDIRYSISWKGYCFVDAAERAVWEEHSDDIGLEQILDAFEKDLRQRGLLDGSRPDPDTFALLMSETYIHFPQSMRAAG